METVQESQIPTSITGTVQESQAPAHNGPLNILLLGVSGVGQSTFINALGNYLSYLTLDEAVKGGLQSPIHSEFQIHYNNIYLNRLKSKNIVLGEPSNYDGCSAELEDGASCPKRCEAYTFPLGKFGEVRFIHTPGILDIKGVDADADNIKHILDALLARYEVLHAVCILLRPDEVTLTNSLKISIAHLRERLHEDASRNILFCFTNSKNTQFTIGSTLPLLENMLKDITVNIDLRSESSMYFFDSEAFRYQVILKESGDLGELEFKDCESSWNKSANEAVRLILHISTLEPHHLKNTLSLNRVRSLLESIQKPLGDIAANIQKNLQETKKTREELQKGRGNISSYVNKLFTMEQYQENVALDHPQMVCTEKTCVGSVCHDKCSPTETTLGMFENLEGNIVEKDSNLDVSDAGFKFVESGLVNPELKLIRKLTCSRDDAVFCKELSYSSGKCRVCGCPNSRHIRVYTKMEPHRTIRDENIQKVLDDTTSTMEKKESILKILERKEEAMKDENKVLVEAAALFDDSLEQNSIVTQNTDAGDSNITEARINEEIQKLYKLELHGPQLKKWMDGIESAAVFEENQIKARGETVFKEGREAVFKARVEAVLKARGEAVFKAPALSSNNAAGVHDGARPKGLRERIAQELHSCSHILFVFVFVFLFLFLFFMGAYRALFGPWRCIASPLEVTSLV